MNQTNYQVNLDQKKNTRCPVCQSDFLQVQESGNQETFLTCSVCGVKFKSAPISEHLMFVETPINFPNNLVGLWLTRAQIGKALHDYRMQINNIAVDKGPATKTINIPKANPLRAQAVREARALISDGKSSAYVFDVLTREMNLNKYAVEEIIKDAFAVKHTRERQVLLKAIYGLLIAIIIIVIAFYLIITLQ
jgi:transcription elongation factor Elf1